MYHYNRHVQHLSLPRRIGMTCIRPALISFLPTHSQSTSHSFQVSESRHMELVRKLVDPFPRTRCCILQERAADWSFPWAHGGPCPPYPCCRDPSRHSIQANHIRHSSQTRQGQEKSVTNIHRKGCAPGLDKNDGDFGLGVVVGNTLWIRVEIGKRAKGGLAGHVALWGTL
jgi:hypothetical protein